MRRERAPPLLTGLARAFLDGDDSGRAAPLGLPVLGSEATFTRVRASIASADGTRGDTGARARARPHPCRALAAQAISAARASPLTARLPLPGGAHSTAPTRVPYHAEIAGVRSRRAAGHITNIPAFPLRPVRDQARANQRSSEQTRHHFYFYFPHADGSLYRS